MLETGKTYPITNKSKYFLDKYGKVNDLFVTIEGTVVSAMGVEWSKQRGSALVHAYISRIYKDKIPLSGEVYCGKVWADGPHSRPIYWMWEILHESEIDTVPV